MKMIKTIDDLTGFVDICDEQVFGGAFTTMTCNGVTTIVQHQKKNKKTTIEPLPVYFPNQEDYNPGTQGFAKDGEYRQNQNMGAMGCVSSK